MTITVLPGPAAATLTRKNRRVIEAMRQLAAACQADPDVDQVRIELTGLLEPPGWRISASRHLHWEALPRITWEQP